MQTFRAYVRDAAGTITWAAWIEAASWSEARGMADGLHAGQPALDLWCATGREPAPGSRLDPV